MYVNEYVLSLSLLPSSRPNELLTDEVNTQLTQEQVLLKGMRYESMRYEVLGIDGMGHKFMEYLVLIHVHACSEYRLHPITGCSIVDGGRVSRFKLPGPT